MTIIYELFVYLPKGRVITAVCMNAGAAPKSISKCMRCRSVVLHTGEAFK